MVVTTTEAHSGNNSGTPTGAYASSVLDLGDNYTDFLLYEVGFYNDGGSGIIGFHEQFSSMLPTFNAVRLRSDGDVIFESADRDTGFSLLIASAISSGWYHVKVELNFRDDLGSVWLDSPEYSILFRLHLENG